MMKGEFYESKKNFIGIIVFRHVDAFCDTCISGGLFAFSLEFINFK